MQNSDYLILPGGEGVGGVLMVVVRLFFPVKLRPYCCNFAQLFVGGTELGFLPLPNYARDVQVI